MGTPDAPLLNNWFDNSCSSINDDCACEYLYEFEFEISNLSCHFPTRHLTDTRLKSVINPVLSAIACVAGVERVGDGEEGKEEGDSLFPRYCALLPLPFPYPFAPATQASTAEAIVFVKRFLIFLKIGKTHATQKTDVGVRFCRQNSQSGQHCLPKNVQHELKKSEETVLACE